jgi:DNA polymerase III sliding clamp (beta) subunit (PCNA family)
MELDREALLAAVKAASAVVANKHTVPMFNAVWLMDGHVLAFNNSGMVINLPMEMPALGGIDGKLLTQLLGKSDEDVVTIDATENGQARIKAGRFTAKLAVLDPVDYVHQLVKPPKPEDDAVEFDTVQLVEDIELDAMLQVAALKAEQALDFCSLTMNSTGTGQVVLFTSDRITINRSLLRIDSMLDNTCSYFVPLEFMKAAKRTWDIFGEGTCLLGNKRILLTGEDDAILYTTLAQVKEPVNFMTAINRVWPEGKIDTKSLVKIPDEFEDALVRASSIAKGDKALVHIKVLDGQLTVSAANEASNFKESIDFDHPDREAKFPSQLLLKSLPYANRMYIGTWSMALFGPKRFSRYIASKS